MGLVSVERKCRVVCDLCCDALDFQALDSFVRKAFGKGLCCLAQFCLKN